MHESTEPLVGFRLFVIGRFDEATLTDEKLISPGN